MEANIDWLSRRGLIKMQPHTCDYHFSQIVIEGQEPALFISLPIVIYSFCVSRSEGKIR